jgi:hypothetical protein
MLDRYLALITYHGGSASSEGVVSPSRWIKSLEGGDGLEGADVRQ